MRNPFARDGSSSLAPAVLLLLQAASAGGPASGSDPARGEPTVPEIRRLVSYSSYEKSIKGLSFVGSDAYVSWRPSGRHAADLVLEAIASPAPFLETKESGPQLMAIRSLRGAAGTVLTLEQARKGELALSARSYPEGNFSWSTLLAPGGVDLYRAWSWHSINAAPAPVAAVGFAATEDGNPEGASGVVVVVSHAGGKVLLRASCADRCRSFGESVVLYPDVDRDQVPEVIVGAPACRRLGGLGVVAMHSVGTGSILWETKCTSEEVASGDNFGFGNSLTLVSDQDSDGYPEVAVGAPVYDVVEILSARSGQRAQFLSSPGGLLGRVTDYGFSVLGLPDLDGDGDQDLLVSAPLWGPRCDDCGRMWVLSRNSGEVLATWNGRAIQEKIGKSVAARNTDTGVEILFSGTSGVYSVLIARKAK